MRPSLIGARRASSRRARQTVEADAKAGRTVLQGDLFHAFTLVLGLELDPERQNPRK